MNTLNPTETLKVTDNTFEKQVLHAKQPVLVDFWAAWCGPCVAIAPVIEELANEFEGRLIVTKLNVDENPLTPEKYGIRSIPTLMIFKYGELQETTLGSQSKSQLASVIDRHLH